MAPPDAGLDNVRHLHPLPTMPADVAIQIAEQAPQFLGEADPLQLELPSAVQIMRPWAPRMALVVSADPPAPVLDALRRRDIRPIVAAPDHSEEAAARIAPFIFLLLGPDALRDDLDIGLVHALHRWSPSARPLLLASPDEAPREVLLRAMRAGVLDVVDPGAGAGVDEAIAAGLIAAGAARERVLAIGAHPDDVEIGCGGTLLDHRRRGDRVSILTLSRGAVGGDTASRVAEAVSTASAIGAQLLMGDLPDTSISDGIDTIRLIEAVVRTLNPTVVYVHSSNDNHQDHRAVASATVSAVRGVRRVFGYQSPSATNAFTPTQFVAVDDVMERKVEVLALFSSQAGRSYLEPEMITAGCRYWARHLAAAGRYAEPFEVIRSIGDLRQASSAPATVLARTPLAALAALVPDSLAQARA
jgi:LmbE family N-acetylglucosaminyl deacetylase